jgi:AAA domain
LVTSKGAPALGVLRERLPECVQELCVDVSKSESSGMRQLQQTVERLANKVAWVNSEREFNKSQALEQTIQELENELQVIDEKLGANAKEKRELVQSQHGQDLFESALELIEQAPWLMQSCANWDAAQISTLYRKVQGLVFLPDDPMLLVDGFVSPPSDDLISLAACKAGYAFSFLKTATKEMLARVPLFGDHMARHNVEIQEQLDRIRVNNVQPGPDDKKGWYLVFERLKRDKAIYTFCQDRLEPLFSRESWPRDTLLETRDGKVHIRAAILPLFERAAAMKRIAEDLGLTSKVEEAIEMDRLDKRRASISARMQTIAEDLVAARVVAELSKNFSSDAQSALVKFAQVSGKAQFGKSSQASKMTQRQRRKRQEYLDAFEKCVRYIPCWILTSSQISDYLPSECLFDLVVIDEASQSDVTVLPGMLRGRQWLIVGDGKQVSPTESFVAEEQIEMLKAAMPESPFESSMLPGHSFFDLCAQAFPMGRVILREHFRCAPEIISYSNKEFYNGDLVPLRLPTSKQRLTPSLIDVRVPNGQKIGKVNERECDVIVDMIGRYVDSCPLLQKRSIGVISLVGDEQSRLIRGRLLDRIGPHKYKLHNVLVGEPPSFQGAERDIVFLSMVCSPRAVVTQSQLMHAQRMNVAMSRARDRMVLVRSIEINHIPNEQDVKFSVLDFFERSKHEVRDVQNVNDDRTSERHKSMASPFRRRAERLLVKLLEQEGYSTLTMGVVWDNAICVENAGGDECDSGLRASICIEATGESHDDWRSMLDQQKSIERVGWSCLRVDAISFLSNHAATLGSIKKFLSSVMVFPKEMPKEVKEVREENAVAPILEVGVVERAMEAEIDLEDDVSEGEVVVISSEEDMDDEEGDRKPAARVPMKEENCDDLDRLGDGETADDYGNVADLGFLGAVDDLLDKNDESDPDMDIGPDVWAPPPVASNPLVPPNGRRSRSNKRKEPVIDLDYHEGSEVSVLEGKRRVVRQMSKQSSMNDDFSEISNNIGSRSLASVGKRQRVDERSLAVDFRRRQLNAADDVSDAESSEEAVDQSTWENEMEYAANGSDDESYRDGDDEGSEIL